MDLKGPLEIALNTLLKTPAVAEQLRKSLVNRDVSLSIDGKEYQILRKRTGVEEEELNRLKVRLWDLERVIRDFIKYCPEAVKSNYSYAETRKRAKELLDRE